MNSLNTPSVGSTLPAFDETASNVSKKSVGEDRSFSQLMGELVQNANSMQVDADNTLQDLIAGNVDNVHDVVLKVAKADLSFRFLMEVRNKVTEAYQQISRMPL